MEKKMSTEDANIELNERLDDGEVKEREKGASSTEEANLKLQEEFYSNNKNETAPTYINNETAAVKISGNND